ncbi:hypothetical protein [Bradyrhizobium canariense]|uniref:Uncharacterized protein n=1 Tax=Bradyrhizobium canariense TaxID=255045 RepID=A0A1H1WVY0_9BRAD|nr:hypothetical protein [Bradyrhizobium canariense]SDT00329.1 hypothetical protein SAMN05444158_4003 [Bradyrhizobium canariense]
MPSRPPAITVFAIALVVVLVAAIATTMQHVNLKQASNDDAPGTIGLAHHHAPLDIAPGQAVR